jgi:hypothetical protein
VTIHLLSQHCWPDCSPVSILCEQSAVFFRDHGYDIKVVVGSGVYRAGSRPDPKLNIIKLPTLKGKRGGILSTFSEYHTVCGAFRRYIETSVSPGEIVIVTSAPPQSFHLIGAIRKKEARAIYWLHDYYPDLLRGFINYPDFVRDMLASHWTSYLRRWDLVVKIAPNLDYEGPNACVLRDWPTLDPGPPRPFEPKTACYFGNLGYGHSLPLFLEMCEKLRADGYKISLVGDGPKVASLPPWIECCKPVDEQTLIDLLWRAEVHLIAADPKMTRAIFPSKYWNSRATGRKILVSGFAGTMLEELNYVDSLKTLPTPEAWLDILRST